MSGIASFGSILPGPGGRGGRGGYTGASGGNAVGGNSPRIGSSGKGPTGGTGVGKGISGGSGSGGRGGRPGHRSGLHFKPLGVLGSSSQQTGISHPGVMSSPPGSPPHPALPQVLKELSPVLKLTGSVHGFGRGYRGSGDGRKLHEPPPVSSPMSPPEPPLPPVVGAFEALTGVGTHSFPIQE